MSDLGLSGLEAQRSAAALQESLASGHLSTQKLQDYQKRVEDIAKSDAPARAIVSAVGAPFLMKGIENNISRVGEVLNRRVAQPAQEALEQVGTELDDRLAQLPSGMSRLFANVAGRAAAADPSALAKAGLGLDIEPIRAVPAGIARAGESSETAARVAAGRAIGDFTSDGDFVGKGDEAISQAANAASRGVVAGEELSDSARGISNLARVGAGKSMLQSMGDAIKSRISGLTQGARAAAADAAERLPSASANDAARVLTTVSGDGSVSETAFGGPATELASAVNRSSLGVRGSAALAESLQDSSPFGQIGPLAKALEADPEEISAAAARLAPSDIPGSTSIMGASRSATASAGQLLSSDLSGQMQGAMEAGKELGASVDTGARGAVSAAGDAVDAAADAGADATGAATSATASSVSDAANAVNSAATEGAEAALDTASAGADAAAGAEGGLNPVADVAALALGLASVLGPALAPRAEVPMPKAPTPIGVAGGVGV